MLRSLQRMVSQATYGSVMVNGGDTGIRICSQGELQFELKLIILELYSPVRTTSTSKKQTAVLVTGGICSCVACISRDDTSGLRVHFAIIVDIQLRMNVV